MAERGYQTSSSRSRRPLYAPPAPGRSQQSVLGYWVPLITVSTIALGGLAAWIWSERSTSDDDEFFESKPPRPSNGQTGPYAGPPGPSTQHPGPLPGQNIGPQGGPPSAGGESSSYYYTGDSASRGPAQEDSTWIGQVRGAMRRTPSPQQFFDSASKQFGGAVAAAGAALGSIMEEDKSEDPRRAAKLAARERKEDREGFSDHERWSEEAEEKLRLGSGAVEVETARRAESALKRDNDKSKTTQKKKTVALVVSADVSSHFDDDDDSIFNAEHTSILSHLPAKQSDSSNVYILIYAPHLTSLPPLDYQPSSAGIDSSYSQISTPAVTPGSELQSISPRIDASDSAVGKRAFDQLYSQALTLVAHPSHILPFTTATGFVQILRHLSPSIVYISDTLSGQDGSAVAQLKGWVGHTILVAGDEGHGGLADTETEDEGTREKRRWYERSSMVGLGKEVEVVDAVRVGEDWVRRVGGRE